MKLRFFALIFAVLPAYAGATDPERSTNVIKMVQERLRIHGFYSGPIDGDPSGATQAALAQFQLSRSLPADGSPDRRTLDELGVVRDEPASAGASLPTPDDTAPKNPASGNPDPAKTER